MALYTWETMEWGCGGGIRCNNYELCIVLERMTICHQLTECLYSRTYALSVMPTQPITTLHPYTPPPLRQPRAPPPQTIKARPQAVYHPSNPRLTPVRRWRFVRSTAPFRYYLNPSRPRPPWFRSRPLNTLRSSFSSILRRTGCGPGQSRGVTAGSRGPGQGGRGRQNYLKAAWLSGWKTLLCTACPRSTGGVDRSGSLPLTRRLSYFRGTCPPYTWSSPSTTSPGDGTIQVGSYPGKDTNLYPVTKAQFTTFEVLVAMPMTRWVFRIVPCLAGGNASATCLKMLAMRFADLQWPAPLSLLRHFTSQCKSLVIIIRLYCTKQGMYMHSRKGE